MSLFAHSLQIDFSRKKPSFSGPRAYSKVGYAMSSLLPQKSRRGYSRLVSRSRSADASAEGVGEKKKAAAGVAPRPSPHPLLKLLRASNKEKAAAQPDFLRYLEYTREAGIWDPSSDRPIIYFK